MKSKNAIYFVLTFYIVLSVLLSGCASKTPSSQIESDMETVQEPSSATQDANQEVVKLTLGSWRTDDVQAMEGILGKFHEEHPNIVVEFSPTLPTEYDAATTTQLTSGTGYDLYYLRSLGSGAAHKLYEAGYFVPIDGLPGLENLPDEVIESWTGPDGQVFGVGMYKNSMGLFYNEKIFTDNNLNLPTTWEELLEVSDELQALGITPFANGYGEPAYVRSLFLWNMIPTLIGGREGRLDYFNGEACMNDENWIELFQHVKDITPYLPNGAAALTNSDSREYFAQGKAAMFFNGSYDIPVITASNPDFEFSIMPVPPPEGQDVYMVAELDAACGINSASAHIEEAKVFLSWLTTKSYAEMVPDYLVGNFHVTKDQDIAPENTYAQQFLDLMASAAGTDARFYLNQGTPGTSALFIDLTVAVLNGSMTPEQAADNLYEGISSWHTPQKDCKN